MSWRTKILDTLECPICYDPIVKGPIFQCLNGHSVCNRCKENASGLLCCPLCRASVPNIRNHLVEDIVNSLLKPCENFDAGCREVFKADDVGKCDSHERKCPFIQLDCPVCNDQILWTDFDPHTDLHRNGDRSDHAPVHKELFRGKWNIDLYLVDTELPVNGAIDRYVGWYGGILIDSAEDECMKFYFMFAYSYYDNEVLIWCYEDLSNTRFAPIFTVEVGKKKNKRFIKYEASCIPLKTPVHQVINDREGLFITSNVLDGLKDGSDLLSLTVTIK